MLTWSTNVCNQYHVMTESIITEQNNHEMDAHYNVICIILFLFVVFKKNPNKFPLKPH